jgi:hypothetical protein
MIPWRASWLDEAYEYEGPCFDQVEGLAPGDLLFYSALGGLCHRTRIGLLKQEKGGGLNMDRNTRFFKAYDPAMERNISMTLKNNIEVKTTDGRIKGQEDLMEYFKKVGFEIIVHELEYDLGYTGYAVVYRQVYDVVKVKQLFFNGDHVFVTRGEAEKILRILAQQYIEGELYEA